MRFLIVDQCSSSKSYPDGVPVADGERITSTPREVIDEIGTVGIPASDLYTGRQQQRINEAVRTLRNSGHLVERLFISAGFGVVDESEELPPYDATFNGMSKAEIDRRSEELGITQDLLDKFDTVESVDVLFLPLGADYYSALDIDKLLDAVPAETHVVLFNREDDADSHQVVSIPARTEEARENGSTVVGLKGTYIKRFATQLDTQEVPMDKRAIADLFRTGDADRSLFEEYE